MTGSCDITLMTTEQNFIVRHGKFEAEVTDNKSIIILLKLRRGTEHRAASLRQQSGDSRATCSLRGPRQSK